MITNRRFGIELEYYNISQYATRDALIAGGLQAEVESYNHTTRSHWKITTDSSLSAVNGYELVSPILKGEEGVEAAKNAGRVLIRAGGKVSRHCGMHLHVEVSDYTFEDFQNLISRYAKFEDNIDMFMPNYRRANNNYTYCKSVRTLTENSYYRSATSVSDLHDNIFRMDKMWKLNLAPFPARGTVEFRQHSGTLDPAKIENWIRFCINLVETSKVRYEEVIERRSVPSSDYGNSINRFYYTHDTDYYSLERSHRLHAKYKIASRRSTRNKIDKLIDDLHTGATEEYLIDLTGYTKASLMVMLSKIRGAGYKIRKDRLTNQYKIIGFKNDRDTSSSSSYYYDDYGYGTSRRNRTEEIVVNRRVDIPNDSWEHGLTPEVINFYNERMQDFEA